jgi:Polyketide cyclase / dehydrase and lipid transport
MSHPARRHAGRLRPATALALLSITSPAWSADLRDISVEYEDSRYHLESRVWLAAPPEDVYRVLTDYDLFVRFTSAFVETYDVAPDEQGRPRFYTRMEGCMLLYCKSLERAGYLLLEPQSEIVAVAVPEKSDFKYCRERWRLVEESGGTLMIYDFEMEPDFWVPPVIGPWIIKRTLREDGIDVIDRIESLARGETPKPVGT